MITMDLKGITWVGNLYHKFESMCLEAEDMIYQDTVKYIENQMQAVGESVKKLYADVTRDLLLPSSCDFDDKVASELPIDQNQNGAVSVSKAEVTRLIASAVDCCYEIQNASTEQFADDPILVKSVEEKQMNTSSSSGSVLFGEPDDFSMDRTIDSDDCYSMVVLSYPDARSSDLTKIGTFLKQGHKTRQEDKLKLEETCVMVIGDELQFVHKQEGGNVNTNKTQRSFSLSKPARKKEYEELAVLHGKSEKVKRLLLPTISEPEWELV